MQRTRYNNRKSIQNLLIYFLFLIGFILLSIILSFKILRAEDNIKNFLPYNVNINQNESCKDLLENDIVYYFFSSSIDHNIIKKNIKISNFLKIKTIFVLRGLIDESPIKTSEELKKITEDEEALFYIDPRLFDNLSVKSVPFMAVKKNDKIYTISGDITIDFFLKKIDELDREDLGNYGKTYEIKEKNMIELLKERSKNFNIKDKLIEAYKRYFNNLPKYTVGRFSDNTTYFIDLTVLVKSPIKNEKGEVLIPEGTVLNPLNIHTITRTLIIFDGSDEKQIKWVTKYIQNNNTINTDFVTANANPLDISNILQKHVFYLQPNMFSNLKIQNLPVIVKQENNLLKVQGVRLDD